MHYKLLLLFTLISFVRNHDVSIGTEGGRKIFEDTRLASPAIWRQVENITVIAPSDEVISKVNITDLRPDKDGDVQIVDGGDGEKSVTIELKSPTVLRGYEFHIEVYSIPKTGSDNAQTTPDDGLDNDVETTAAPEVNELENSKVIPASIVKDSDIVRPARETNDQESETEKVTDETTSEYTTDIDNESTTENNEGSGEDSASLNLDPDVLRPARHASEDENPDDNVETTTEMEDFEIKGTLDYIPTTEETGSENTPILIGDDAVRPARETTEENQSDVTTEDVNEDTTEYTTTTDNAMNKSNYSNLDILELIKRKEQGARQVRRTDENESSSESESESEESSEPPSNNETVGLVPPEEDAPYNDNFSTDTTETPMEQLETTLSSNPRPVRRLELPLEYYTTTDTDETTTEVAKESTLAEGTTTESIEENPRKSRNTDNFENNLSLDNETNVEANILSNDRTSSGVVLIKGNDVIITADGKQVHFNLPIVLIIGNEQNFPLFNLIDNQKTERQDVNADPDIILDENNPEYTSLDPEAASVIMNDDSY